MMGGKVFISYATPDFSQAEGLCKYLEQSGSPVWIAPRDIPVSGYHGEAAAEAIKDARCVVLIFTGHTNTANFVRNELDYAISCKRRIIPVRLDGSRPTFAMQFLLAGSQWVDGFQHADDEWHAWIAELIDRPDSASETERPWLRPAHIFEVSRVALTAGVLIPFAVFSAALIRTRYVVDDTGCSGSLIGCLADPMVVAAIVFLVLGLSVLLPRLVTRPSTVVLEARDAIAMATGTAILTVAGFLQLWLTGLVAMAYCAGYLMLRRHANIRRAAWSAAAVLAIAVLGWWYEGSLYRWMMNRSNSALLLFDHRRTAEDLSDGLPRRVYNLFVQSISNIPTDVGATPRSQLDKEDEFRRTYSRNVTTGLAPLLQRSVLQFEPFNIVVVVDASGSREVCPDRGAVSIFVHVSTYELGEAPNWTAGRREESSLWQDFEIVIGRAADGTLKNAGDVEGLFLAHFASWLTSEPKAQARARKIENQRLIDEAFELMHFNMAKGYCGSTASESINALCAAKSLDTAAKAAAMKLALAKRPAEIRPPSCAPDQDRLLGQAVSRAAGG
jgi:hypothetical protein